MGFGDRPEPYEESGLARDIRRMREQDRIVERRPADAGTGRITDWPGDGHMSEAEASPEYRAQRRAVDAATKPLHARILELELKLSAVMASIPNSTATNEEKLERYHDVRRILYYPAAGKPLNPRCCSASVPCDHQRKSPGTVCNMCTLAHMQREGVLDIRNVWAQLLINGEPEGDAQPCKLYIDTSTWCADVDRYMEFPVSCWRDRAVIEVAFYDGTNRLCSLTYKCSTAHGDHVKVTPGPMGGVPAPAGAPTESPHRFSVTR